MFIGKDIRTAFIEDRCVILDLKSEEYSVLSGAFAEIVKSKSSGQHDCSEFPSDAVKELLDAKILVSSGDPVANEVVESRRPSLECLGPMIGSLPHIPFHIRLAAVAAIVKTALMLKVFGLTKLARSFEAEKLQMSSPRKPPRVSKEDLIYALRSTRPYFYNPKDRCIINAFSAAFFLQRFGYPVNVKIGVSLDPFEAHCWAEDEQLLYCDVFTRTERFTTILQV